MRALNFRADASFTFVDAGANEPIVNKTERSNVPNDDASRNPADRFLLFLETENGMTCVPAHRKKLLLGMFSSLPIPNLEPRRSLIKFVRGL